MDNIQVQEISNDDVFFRVTSINNTVTKFDYNGYRNILVESEYIKATELEVSLAHWGLERAHTWRTMFLSLVFLYPVAVYFGVKWMKNRPAFVLKKPLFVWNAFLAIFSVFAFIRGFPETVYLYNLPEGLSKVLCSSDINNVATLFWALLFMVSKIWEFGDTAFLILRKRKLIFLHWFHHFSTALIVWFTLELSEPIARLYIINGFVHSLMYSYYALAALDVKFPKIVSMSLTVIQILQMVLAMLLNLFGLFTVAKGYPCRRNMTFFVLCGCVGLIFFSLFVNYFVQTYLRKSTEKKQK